MLESGISPEGKPQTCFDGDLSLKWALTKFGDPLSVLEIAALSNNTLILQKLVRPSFLDSQLAGRALAITILENNAVVIPPLLDWTNINAPPASRDGCTALEGAANHGRTGMLHPFLDYGASVLGVDGEQQYENAVEMAEQNGHHAASRLLRALREQKEAEASASAVFDLESAVETDAIAEWKNWVCFD
ncbi:hypothetical protein BJX62DRAFT_238231 [Aspergillus germanicus]